MPPALPESLAAQAERYADYARRHRLKRAGGFIGWERLLGRRGPGIFHAGYLPCHLDHFSLWNRDRRAVRFLTEPYDLKDSEKEDLWLWAMSRGLDVRIDREPAPWAPGIAHLIEIARPEEFARPEGTCKP